MDWTTSNYVSLEECLIFLYKMHITIAIAEFQLYSIHCKSLSSVKQNVNNELLAERIILNIQQQINTFLSENKGIIIKPKI